MITTLQWKDWRTPGHADENLIIIRKVEDVETVLITLDTDHSHALDQNALQHM